MFDVQLDRTRAFTIARLSGALSASDADRLDDTLGELPYGDNARLAVDLSALRTIDSSGLAELIAIVTRSRMTRSRGRPRPVAGSLDRETAIGQSATAGTFDPGSFEECMDIAGVLSNRDRKSVV